MKRLTPPPSNATGAYRHGSGCSADGPMTIIAILLFSGRGRWQNQRPSAISGQEEATTKFFMVQKNHPSIRGLWTRYADQYRAVERGRLPRCFHLVVARYCGPLQQRRYCVRRPIAPAAQSQVFPVGL